MVSLSLTLQKLDALIGLYKSLEAELGPPTEIGQAVIDSLHRWRDAIMFYATALELTALPTCVEDCERMIEQDPDMAICRSGLRHLARGVKWLTEKYDRDMTAVFGDSNVAGLAG